MKTLPVMLLRDRNGFWERMRAQDLRWKDLLPLVAFVVFACGVSTARLPFVVLLVLLIWSIALAFAARYVGKLSAHPLFQRQAGIKLWFLILTLVTLQMATCMRPMLAKPENGWWTAEKKFFLSHFGSTFEQKK